MKISKMIKKEVEQEVIKDILCNKCGNSQQHCSGRGFTGIKEFYYIGGYASILGDGDQYKFSLCEQCMKELFSTFKHPAYIGEFDGVIGEEWPNGENY